MVTFSRTSTSPLIYSACHLPELFHAGLLRGRDLGVEPPIFFRGLRVEPVDLSVEGVGRARDALAQLRFLRRHQIPCVSTRHSFVQDSERTAALKKQITNLIQRQLRAARSPPDQRGLKSS